MSSVFADTYYYLAWVNSRDQAHGRARQFAADFRDPIVTTSAVLIEVGDALCRQANRSSFLKVLDDIEADANTTMVQVDQDLLKQGLELFRARPDKDWSLTDCISFSVMTELGLADALTGDRHFIQAGFRALLAPTS